MFGIGITEIIIILVVALLVVGPKKLPELAKTLGRGLAEFRRTADEFKDSIYQDEVVDSEQKKSGQQHKTSKITYPVDPPDTEADITQGDNDGLVTSEGSVTAAIPKTDNLKESQQEDVSA